MRNFLLIMVTVFLSSNILAVSNPNKEIKVGVLKFGTANWELKTTLDNGIDAKHDFKLNVVGLADKKATAAAFLGGYQCKDRQVLTLLLFLIQSLWEV